MKYLHSNNFIHRDLKPTNILLDNDFYPRICDFGLSRESNKDIDHFIMNSSVGNELYMAPEMNSKIYNFKVDIYSFSIVLFELITGKQNFDLDLIKGDENIEFIKKCHSKKPSKRPTFVEIENFIRQKSFISLFGKVKEDQVKAFENWIENCQKNNDDEKNDNDNKNNDNDCDNENDDNNNDYDNENDYNDNDNDNDYDNDNDNDNDYDNENNDNDSEYNNDDYEYEKAYRNDDDENEEDYYNSDLDDDDNENDNNDQFILFKDTRSISYKLYTRNNTAKIVESSKVRGNIFIPTFINYSKQKYKIIDICDNAFKDSHITSLSFANDSCVKRIGNNAFQNSPISNLSIPKSLIKLDKEWCKGANNLSEIDIDEDNALFFFVNGFLFFNNIEKYELIFAPKDYNGEYLVEEDTVKIGNSCFANARSIISLTSNTKSLKLLDSFAFYNCEMLQNVTITEVGKLEIGDSCFAKSEKLSIFQLDCEEVEIGENCFEKCSNLSNAILNISKKLTLKSKAFKECNSLAHLCVNTKEIVIEDEYFENIHSLGFKAESISFSDKFVHKCSSLSFIVIQSNQNIEILTSTFQDCNELKNVTIKTLSDLKLKLNCLKNKRKLESIELSGKNVVIEDKCFANCISLINFKIKKSGNIKIGSNQFQNCTKLKSISIKSTINPENNFNIEFGDKCFSGLINLNSFLIKGGNITINNQCLTSCTSLENLLLLNVKDVIIDSEHFSNSNSLKKVIINSSSNVELNRNSFYRATKIDSFIIGGENISIKESCFEECSSLNTISIIHTGNITLGKRAFYKCNKLSIIDIDVDSNITIDDKCFYGINANLVHLNGNNIIIGNECFKNCSSINNFQIQFSNIVKIGYNSFEKCKDLKHIIINAGSELTIGDYCFSYSNNIQFVTFDCPDISFGEYCFYNCPKLKNISMPSAKDISVYKKSFNLSYINNRGNAKIHHRRHE